MSNCKYPRCSCKATGVYCKDKPASGPKAKKAIRKQSDKAKVKKTVDMALHKNDAAFYMEIWEERVHIDFETGLPLTEGFSNLLFHHVLPKREGFGGYPQYRYCKWNIVLLSWVTHTQAEIDLNKTPVVKTYTERLLQLHESGLLETADSQKHYL